MFASVPATPPIHQSLLQDKAPQRDSTFRRVHWSIWIAVAALSMEGLGNSLVAAESPTSINWVLFKCVAIVGLILGNPWITVGLLIVSGFHIVAFLLTAPIVSLMNLALIGLVIHARRYSFAKWCDGTDRAQTRTGHSHSRRVQTIAIGIPVVLLGMVSLGLVNKSRFCSGWSEHYSREAVRLRSEAAKPGTPVEAANELRAAADLKELISAKYAAVSRAPWRAYPKAPLISKSEMKEVTSKYE